MRADYMRIEAGYKFARNPTETLVASLFLLYFVRIKRQSRNQHSGTRCRVLRSTVARRIS